MFVHSIQRLCSTSIRSSISSMGVPELVKSLGALANSRPSEIGVAADLMGELTCRVHDFKETRATGSFPIMAESDLLSFVASCSKMRVFDSELFRLLDNESATEGSCLSLPDTIRLINCLSKLGQYDVFHKLIWDSLRTHREEVTQSRLDKSLLPLLRFWKQYLTEGGDTPGKPPVGKESMLLTNWILQLVYECVEDKVALMKKDKQLMISRRVVGAREVLDTVVYVGALVRWLRRHVDCSSAAFPTDNERSNLMYLNSHILGYELRNLDLDSLFKLFFALKEIELFDDFFVRRRLVPAIDSVVRALYSDSTMLDKKRENNTLHNHLVLLLNVLGSVPFKNQMTADLMGISRRLASEADLKGPHSDTINRLISKLG